ncbi:neuronal acetylcholine receptor subunit beta-3-like [Glandiceps talaboti]
MAATSELGFVVVAFKFLVIFESTVIISSYDTHVGMPGFSSEERLMKELFDRSCQLTRPVTAVNETVTVNISIALTQLIDVDEKSQIITTNLWVYQEWYDPRLSWNKMEHSGLSLVTIPIDKIWVPDTSLLNSMDNEFDSFPRVHIKGQNVYLFDSGVVTKVTPVIAHTPCIMNIKYFPVDEQHCLLEFGLWAYTDSQVLLRTGMENVPFENFLPNVEWDIPHTETTEVTKKFLGVNDTFTSIIASIDIKRKPLYYVVNLIVPCALVSVLTVLVFCLPSNSSDKVSLSISLLLTIYVFNLLVTDLLPATSQQLPLLTMYLLVIMGLISLSVVLTAFVSQIYDVDRCDPSPVPKWVKFVLFGRVARVLLPKKKARKEKYISRLSTISKPGSIQRVQRKYRLEDDTIVRTRARINETYEADVETVIPRNSRKKASTSRRANNLKGLVPKSKQDWLLEKLQDSEKRFYLNVMMRLDKILRSMDKLVNFVSPREAIKENTDDWIFLAALLDRIFLILFSLASTAAAFLILPRIT